MYLLAGFFFLLLFRHASVSYTDLNLQPHSLSQNLRNSSIPQRFYFCFCLTHYTFVHDNFNNHTVEISYGNITIWYIEAKSSGMSCHLPDFEVVSFIYYNQLSTKKATWHSCAPGDPSLIPGSWYFPDSTHFSLPLCFLSSLILFCTNKNLNPAKNKSFCYCKYMYYCFS